MLKSLDIAESGIPKTSTFRFPPNVFLKLKRYEQIGVYRLFRIAFINDFAKNLAWLRQ